MILLFFFFLFVPILVHYNFPVFLSETVHFFQSHCTSLVPYSSRSREFISAISCGTPLHQHFWREIFGPTLLMHWIVVSGSHLVLVEKIFLFFQKFLKLFLKKFLKVQTFSLLSFLRFLFLLSYLFFTGLQAPAVRSFLQMELGKIKPSSKINFSILWICLFSGFGTLLIFPQWISSLSLPLSWTASLALVISGLFRQKTEAQQFLQNHFLVFLFMFPLLTQISTPNPLALAVSLVLTPIFAWILFPFSLLCLIFSPLTQILDPILEFLILGIKKILPELKFIESSPPASLTYRKMQFWVWSYVFILNLLVVLFCIYKNRKNLSHETP